MLTFCPSGGGGLLDFRIQGGFDKGEGNFRGV